MRFTSTLVLAFSALTSLVCDKSTTPSGAPPTSTGASAIGNPNPISYPLGGTLKAGIVIGITWNPTTGSPVNLILRQGEENNLAEVGTIASGIPNSGSFSWAIPKDIVAGKDYSIQIVSGKDSNYSPLFGIDSTVTSSSVSSTKSQTSSTRSSTSSTSTSSSTSPSSTSSATPTTTPSSNSSTTTTHSSIKTSTPTNATTTTPAPTVSDIDNVGTNLASSLPLVFCIIAGLVYLI